MSDDATKNPDPEAVGDEGLDPETLNDEDLEQVAGGIGMMTGADVPPSNGVGIGP